MRRLLSKIQKQQYQLLSNLRFDDTDDDYYNDTPDIYDSYRRPELVNVEVVDPDDNDLTDEIKLRLAVARLKALQKHREVWG